ncbi:MAG TPA: 50S ribosomal protein L11 methyltransferase [Devosia sp.]|jgi:predicted nicotinamide N-methyase|nr:50S ribosomal protein L11 methyltransferase [Devosia sp.]
MSVPPERSAPSVGPSGYIQAHLRLEPVAGLPHIRLYQAHSGSRLSRLIHGYDAPAPYWAFPWAGGLALGHHFRARPELVAGRRVLDLGAGSGLVAISAALAGAEASAAEIDKNGQAAIVLNAAANGVATPLVEINLDGAAPSNVDVVAAGDVFYDADVGRHMLPFLRRCNAAGLDVLIGDPGRRDLPADLLQELASYSVGDVGDPRNSAGRTGIVFKLR